MNIPDKIFLSQTDVKFASQHGSASTYIPYVSGKEHARLIAEKDQLIATLTQEPTPLNGLMSDVDRLRECIVLCERITELLIDTETSENGEFPLCEDSRELCGLLRSLLGVEEVKRFEREAVS